MTDDQTRGIGGRGRSGNYFLPSPLPPIADLACTDTTQSLLRATHDLLDTIVSDTIVREYAVELNLVTAVVESVASIQIEGEEATSTSLLVALKQDAEAAHSSVAKYYSCLRQSLERPAALDFANAARIHRCLFIDDEDMRPGQTRDRDVFVGTSGTALYNPPPGDRVSTLLQQYSAWSHAAPLSLASIAVAHAHFLTIHPFVDGNGRATRILTTRALASLFQNPVLLPISVPFLRGRGRYYEELMATRASDDWNAWIAYFATAVGHAAVHVSGVSRLLAAAIPVAQQTLSSPNDVRSFLQWLFLTPIVDSSTRPDDGRWLDIVDNLAAEGIVALSSASGLRGLKFTAYFETFQDDLDRPSLPQRTQPA